MVSQAIPDISVGEDQDICTSLSWRGIEGERILPFPSNSVCGTETLSDSSNNHYCLSHLQDLLDILGLSEIESLGGCLVTIEICQQSVCSFRVDRRPVQEGRRQTPSLLSLQQIEES